MSNTTNGVRVSRDQQQRAFDALPPPVREVIARAPFDYIVTGMLREFRQFNPPPGVDKAKAYRKHLVLQLADDLQRAAYKAYGPDHPDAARNRVTGLPLDNPPKRRAKSRA